MTGKVLRVGILGAGEIVENIYLPILHSQPTRSSYQVTSIYSSTPESLDGIQKTHSIAKTTSNPDDVLHDPSIDLIINALPNEFHETYIVASLDAGKHVVVDAPITLSLQSTRRILEAEKRAPNAARVFVSYARRYAPCFEEVFKREVAGLDRIYYARCRNISGPLTRLHRPCKTNGTTTASNGLSTPASSINANGDGASDSDSGSDNSALCQELLQEVFNDQDLNSERVALCRFLASTGCHDLSVMRETLGPPDGVSCVSVNDPFYSAIFHYKTVDKDGEDQPFTLMYEAGTDAVPRCEAHLVVYGGRKTVAVYFDSVHGRGHPVRVVVEEMDETGRLKTTESLSSCDDAYRREFGALYGLLVDGEEAKTTAGDAMMELKLFRMMFEQYDRQCGTIRTPLG